MKPRRRSWTKLLLVLVILLAVFVYYLWTPLRQAFCVASIQDAVPRESLSFGKGWYPQKPPPWLDEKVTAGIEWYFSDARGGTKVDRDKHLERFHSLFSSPIERIEIKSPGALQGDAGVSLAWFPKLHRVKILDDRQNMTETDWRRICRGLSRSNSAQEILLSGETITDAAIAQLARQSSLQIITIGQSVLTAECATTFSSLPKLKTLILGAPKRSNRRGFSFKEKDEIAAKLSNVELTFSQSYYAMP